jgi:hypothetical protein
MPATRSSPTIASACSARSTRATTTVTVSAGGFSYSEQLNRARRQRAASLAERGRCGPIASSEQPRFTPPPAPPPPAPRPCRQPPVEFSPAGASGGSTTAPPNRPPPTQPAAAVDPSSRSGHPARCGSYRRSCPPPAAPDRATAAARGSAPRAPTRSRKARRGGGDSRKSQAFSRYEGGRKPRQRPWSVPALPARHCPCSARPLAGAPRSVAGPPAPARGRSQPAPPPLPAQRTKSEGSRR